MTRYSIIILSAFFIASCTQGPKRSIPGSNKPQETIKTNINGQGPGIVLELYKGKSFYYPLMALWLEDKDGNYIQTLYVARSVATGVFMYGKQEGNRWIPGPRRAPQTLPYWAHKRGIVASDGLYMPEPDNPVADAYTGATPVSGFTIDSKADNSLPEGFQICFEINQNWDWNEYWTNDKYPNDQFYKMSCQPALVYKASSSDLSSTGRIKLTPVGHSHYSGASGELFPDLSTLTTALSIADSVIVTVRK